MPDIPHIDLTAEGERLVVDVSKHFADADVALDEVHIAGIRQLAHAFESGRLGRELAYDDSADESSPEDLEEFAEFRRSLHALGATNAPPIIALRQILDKIGLPARG